MNHSQQPAVRALIRCWQIDWQLSVTTNQNFPSLRGRKIHLALVSGQAVLPTPRPPPPLLAFFPSPTPFPSLFSSPQFLPCSRVQNGGRSFVIAVFESFPPAKPPALQASSIQAWRVHFFNHQRVKVLAVSHFIRHKFILIKARHRNDQKRFRAFVDVIGFSRVKTWKHNKNAAPEPTNMESKSCWTKPCKTVWPHRPQGPEERSSSRTFSFPCERQPT